MKNISLIFLVIVTVVGFALRFYRISDRPDGFTWDEAALGYNAYSLIQTGKDEHGTTLPIVFKSFGDYKPGLYVYLAVLPVHLFGLNELSTRLPSAILGTLSIIATYILCRQLKFSQIASLSSAFVLACMPWAIHFSRGAWESNCAVTFTVLAAILFFRKKYLFAALFFGSTFWLYQNAKLFTPIIMLSLVVINYKYITYRKVLLPAIVLVLMLIPILISFSTQSGRLKVYSVFSYSRSDRTLQELASQDNTSIKNPLFSLFHAELIDQSRGVVQRYLNAFSSRFLFKEGDWSNVRNTTIFYGNLHLIDVVPLIIGCALVLQIRRKSTAFIVIWLIAAPLGAAFSRDIISGVRSLPMVIPLSIIIGVGLSRLLQSKILLVIYIIFVSYGLATFADLYINHAPLFTAKEWLYPYKSAMLEVKKIEPEYNHIVITDNLGQPYIYALFYGKVDPKMYQLDHEFVESTTGDVGEVKRFGKYTFRHVFWPTDRAASSTVFVGDEFELPEGDLQTTQSIQRHKEIYYPDGTLALRIVAKP